MSGSIRKSVLVAAVAALSALACVGPAGPQGEAGPAGPAGAQGAQGPGFEAGPSISLVSPSSVVVGKTAQIQISGFATQWSDSATVSFGSGVTVKKIHAASDTALLVDIEVSADATVGTRDVTVTEGDQTSTYAGGFTLKAQVESAFVGTGTQLSVDVVKLVSNDPDYSLPTSSNDLQVAAPTGINGGLYSSNGTSAMVLLTIDLDAAEGAAEVVVTLYPASAREKKISVPVNVMAASVGTLEDGTPQTGTLSGWESASFKYNPSTTGQVFFNVSGDAGAPMAVLLDGTGSFGSAATAGLTDVTQGTDYYVVLWANEGKSSAFTLETTQPTSVTDTEPNDTAAAADALPAIPGFPAIVSGDFTYGDDAADYFKVTLGEDAVGKHVHVSFAGGDADVVAELFGADGTTSLDQSPNLYENHDYTMGPAITAAGTYYLAFELPSYYDGGYQVVVTLQ